MRLEEIRPDGKVVPKYPLKIMKHIFKDWDKLKKELSDKYIMLFLDYDGTLTPIADKPKDANIPLKTKSVLEGLSRRPDCKVAVISGRSLEDIKKMVGIKGIIYSGNHGLEIEGPKIKFRHSVSARYQRILQNIETKLKEKFVSVEGVFVENKVFSLSFHFRLAKEKDIPFIKDSFREATISYLLKNNIKVGLGKKVLEVRPPIEWDKGKIVLWLLARQQVSRGEEKILPLYIGDDLTDEDAFEVLKNKGLTVFVGTPTRQSHARYYLEDTKEAFELLNRILAAKNKKNNA
ncbi:MAG: trehalose-phosphatase [Candidatus Omnitrophota bacterium]